MGGCGPILMPVILGEVGNINRFFSAKHFDGYAGFVPVECESGPHKGEKHIKNGQSKGYPTQYSFWRIVSDATTNG